MNRNIFITSSIIQTLKQMDTEKVKSLFVFNEDKFEGLITIGDIQRAILKGIDLSSPISSILDKNKIYAFAGESMESVKNKMSRLRAECMPVLDKDGNLVEVYYWKDLFGTSNNKTLQDINLPVVIMAGGQRHSPCSAYQCLSQASYPYWRKDHSGDYNG